MKRGGAQIERAARSGFAAVALLLVSCDRAPPPAAGAALSPGVLARVGSIAITADRVARIAAAQHVSPTEARAIAVGDALLARGAEARGLDRSPAVQQQISGELARRVLRRLLTNARATPPTEAEIRDAASRRWLDVDRPEGFRTVHAVALYDPNKQGEDVKQKARAWAEAVRAAVAPIAARAASMPLPEGAPLPTARQRAAEDPDPLSSAFRAAVAAVPHPGIDVAVEPLSPVAADGRVLVAGEGTLVPEFAAAAAALPERGALSPVVTSPFGFHVILLLERTPAQILTGAARVARLRDDIVNERARAAEKRLLAQLAPHASIATEAPGLLDLVSVEP
jgi:peptidyl-prolyl cis-trans isomerase C